MVQFLGQWLGILRGIVLTFFGVYGINGIYFGAPFEVGIFGEGSVAQLALEELVDVVRQDALQQDIQMIEVVLRHVLVREIGQLAERTHGIHDAPVADLSAEVGASTSTAATMDAVEHRNHLHDITFNVSMFIHSIGHWVCNVFLFFCFWNDWFSVAWRAAMATKWLVNHAITVRYQ